MVSLHTDVGEYTFVQLVFGLTMLNLWMSKSVRLAVDVAIFGKVRVEFGILHSNGFRIVPVCLEKVNLQILLHYIIYSYNF